MKLLLLLLRVAVELADANVAVNLKAEIEKLTSRLQSEQLQNELLKRQLDEFNLQSELNTSKLNVKTLTLIINISLFDCK